MNYALAGISYLITAVALILLTVRVRTLISLYKKQQPDPTRSNNKSARLKNMFKEVLGHTKMLKFTGYQSLYSYGAGAVILNGELGRMDNIPIIVTELLPKPGLGTDAADALGGLNAAGKFDGATYTKATGVLVNKNAYMWGDRKEFALELWRNPMNQTTNLIGSQRLDFEKVLGATDPTTAVGYNY